MTGARLPLTRDVVFSSRFLDPLRDALHDWSCSLAHAATGGFRQNADVGVSVMSSTDVAWIRYATNDPAPGAPDRDRFVRYLQSVQDAQTGRVRHDPGPAGQGHCDGHAFWQTVRALSILGGELLHFPRHLAPMATPSGLADWFDRIDWASAPPGQHHEVLGLVPIVVSSADDRLTEVLLQKIGEQQNPDTGAWPSSETSISRTFAYTALHLAAGRLPAHPERIIDEMLRLQTAAGLWNEGRPYFQTMDAAYLLLRLPTCTGHRKAEAHAALRRLSEAMRPAFLEHQAELMANPHHMSAVVHTFALLQQAFPEDYPSERPYRFDWDKADMYVHRIMRR